MAQICIKSFVGWGFALDPPGGAYSATPDPLADVEGGAARGRGTREKRGKRRGREKKGEEGEGRGLDERGSWTP